MTDHLNAEEVRRLIRTLGEAGGRLPVSRPHLAQIRAFFAHRVLRTTPDDYILRKFSQHVEGDGHWPTDTLPDEYLASLRETVLDPTSAVYLTDRDQPGTWSIYFVGRVRRAWRGPTGSNRLIVIFNADRFFLITGFQPSQGDAYVERQGGFWLWTP